jgi:hypothetical protein
VLESFGNYIGIEEYLFLASFNSKRGSPWSLREPDAAGRSSDNHGFACEFAAATPAGSGLLSVFMVFMEELLCYRRCGSTAPACPRSGHWRGAKHDASGLIPDDKPKGGRRAVEITFVL